MSPRLSRRAVIDDKETYVSRAAYKLAAVAPLLALEFKDKSVLDVGSSTGGFSDFALQNKAAVVIAVEKGTNQLHTKLRQNSKVKLHEKTDIIDFQSPQKFDLILIDVSFVSLREILPAVANLADPSGYIVAMVKPQFEAKTGKQMHQGVIKNERIRRQILKEFEAWLKPNFLILAKADSPISGVKGNVERFYKLKKLN